MLGFPVLGRRRPARLLDAGDGIDPSSVYAWLPRQAQVNSGSCSKMEPKIPKLKLRGKFLLGISHCPPCAVVVFSLWPESKARKAMARSGTNPDAETPAQPLPLFRPEALAAQETIHGEVLRIRPLSLVFFLWLGAALGAAALIYLLAGHNSEKTRQSLLHTNSARSIARLETQIPLARTPLIHCLSDRSAP
jgi:hypothetical protein